jgi:lysophospholipase L1-like esterase
VTNTVAETVTILVQANGVSLSSTPTVQFVAGPPAQISIVTQPSASAASGAIFEQQPVIQLLDGAGNPVMQADVVVTAAIAIGGGTLGGTQAVSTNAFGIATFTDLSISGTVGERRLEFSAQGIAPDTSQTISVTAGAAEQIGLQAGDGQSATVGTAVSIPPAVLVTDAAGNPVEGVSVTFAITAGGGSLAASGIVSTDADGIATSPAWTLGATPGANTLTATATGLTGSPVTFTATGTAAEGSAVRIVTFGDSNTDYGYASTTSSSIEARSYVSNRITGRLAPADAHHPNQLAGLIEARWVALESSDITAVNHGIGGTTSGGGSGGGSERHSTTAPNARTEVNGITRYEAEVLGKGYPWNGDESDAVEFPDGGIVRVNSFVPAANDFAYVSIGTNDQNSGVSATQTIANLTWMVDTWLAEGLPAQQFIITTLAPRGTAGGAIPQINTEIRTLAAARGIKLIDLAAHTSDDNGATWRSADLHVGDELHYTVAVRAWIADQVVAHMRSVTPDLMISGRE